MTFTKRLSGGSINEVYYVRFARGREAVFKYNPDASKSFFTAEQHGLTLLNACKAWRVPRVYVTQRHGILIQWFAGDSIEAKQQQAERAGELLARQHRMKADYYGFRTDNYIGLLSQDNTPHKNWSDFYRQRRLCPQFERAIQSGLIPEGETPYVHRLLERLGDWLDAPHVQPSLLHGDLWSGNWLATRNGPAVIDPAVYYGHREVDLAMVELFGGFPASFFTAYNTAYPLQEGYTKRRPLYQLYYLLVHLNLFGAAYLSPVMRIVRSYGT